MVGTSLGLRGRRWGTLLCLAALGSMACSKIEFYYEDVEGGAGSGGTSSGGAPSGGAWAGGAAGLGGGSGLEDCTNALDDDSDGLVDCADTTDCDCLPQVLAGWQGPYVVTPPAIDAAAPAPCPEGTEVDVLGLVEALPANCPTCKCGAPTGGCTQASSTYHAGENCTGASANLWTWSTGCQATGFSGTPPKTISVKVEPTGASCPSSESGTESAPPTRLIERVRVCAPPLGTCSAGHCGSRLPAGHKACVLGATSQACPVAYSVQRDLDTGTILGDTRKCTGCGCAISQAKCAGWKVLHGLSCSQPGGFGAFGPTVPCKTLSTSAVGLSVESLGSVSATCTPTGGQPNGKVTTEKLRLCCSS